MLSILGFPGQKRATGTRRGLGKKLGRIEALEQRCLLSVTGPESGADILPDDPMNSLPRIDKIEAVPFINVENDVVTLKGAFADRDLDDSHSVLVTWGDGHTSDIRLEQGARTFALEHQYLNNPFPGPADPVHDFYGIGVTVIDSAGGEGSDETNVVVHNARPEFTDVSMAPEATSGAAVVLKGAFEDPGTLDVHTIRIDWGDGTTDDLELEVGDRAFEMEHQYPYTFAPASWEIKATVFDDDGARDTVVIPAPGNTAPEIQGLRIRGPIREGGYTYLSGTFTDPDRSDAHTVIVDWGDGTVDEWNLRIGGRQIGKSHRYLDNPELGPTDELPQYQVTVTVLDDAGGEDTDWTWVEVRNVAPEFTSVEVLPVSTTPTGVVLGAEFVDAGLLDKHTVTVEWGDGTIESWDLEVGAREFLADHDYAADTGAVPQNSYEVRLIIVDDDSGRDVETLTVTVPWNAAPKINNDLKVTPSIKEGDFVYLEGSFVDPNLDDAHTIIVDWGDGTVDEWNLRIGGRQIGKSHQYLDNPDYGPIDGSSTGDEDADGYGIPNRLGYPIKVTVLDDAGGKDGRTLRTSVWNVAPEFESVTVEPTSASLNEYVLAASFVDPGLIDTHRVTVLWGDGTIESWELEEGARDFQARHSYDATTDPALRYEVRVIVVDDDGGHDVETVIIGENTAPEITSLEVTPEIQEGGVVRLRGEFVDPDTADTHTVVVDWGDGTSDEWVVRPGSREITASHQYLDNPEPTAIPEPIYRITVVVRDDAGGGDDAAAWTEVWNVAPDITKLTNSAEMGGSGWFGNRVWVWGNFEDPGILDEFDSSVDWGDGTEGHVQIYSFGGNHYFYGMHEYESAGVYRIGVTIADDDFGRDTALTTAVVSGITLGNDGVLKVYGTNRSDFVQLDRVGDEITVRASFLRPSTWAASEMADQVASFPVSDVGRAEIMLFGGTDVSITSTNVWIPTLVDGGLADDILIGGSGPDVLLGGAGNDYLLANAGYDILIGGRGRDVLAGGTEDDILIGGWTVYDAPVVATNAASATVPNVDALMAILSEWNLDLPFEVRQGHINGTLPGGANGKHYLNSDTVFGDAAFDFLFGDAGQDWLFDEWLIDRAQE